MSQASAAAAPPTPGGATALAPPATGAAVAGAGSAPAPGQPATGPAGLPTGVGSLEAARGIPRFLVRLRLIAALTVVLFTFLTAGQLALGVNAAEQARADAQQVIRIQDLKADLLRADALATNAFLVGGLESADRRTAYDAAIADATKEIAAAAQAQAADQAALAELSGLVVRYASAMEVARANNRLGLPVGAAYLRSASADLRDRGMGLVDALLTANTARAEQSLGDQHPLWVAIPGLLAIGVLIWANRWIAQRFRRRFNIGLVIATLAVAVVTVSAAAVAAMQAWENDDLQKGDYAVLLSAAEARGEANAAKSSESLRLIARGSGKVFEDAWAAHATRVRQIAPSDLVPGWQRYAEAHQQVVALDDGGDWDGAVAVATSADTGTSPAFTGFDDSVASRVTDLSKRVDTTLASGAHTPWVIALLAIAMGLLATWGAWTGVSRRLEEYS